MLSSENQAASGERLQKALARAGHGSRRHIETLIAAGRVRVNGEVAALGARLLGHEKVLIDGQVARIPTTFKRRILAYYKPVGELTTRSDPQGRPTVFDRLPQLSGGRWIGIGRLDYNTQGLLLVSNDGDLAQRLMHPRYEIEREYAVRILGEPTPAVIQQLLQGVELDDGPGRFDSIQVVGGSGANRWYHVVLREGRQREVRRLWESQGLQVSRLVRVRYGPITLRRGLRMGEWDELTLAQRNELLEAIGLPVEVASPAPSTRWAAAKSRSDNRHRPKKPSRRR